MVNKDKTGTERQQRRRQREKAWLQENGLGSWEALHTALMNGIIRLTPRAADKSQRARLKIKKVSGSCR